MNIMPLLLRMSFDPPNLRAIMSFMAAEFCVALVVLTRSFPKLG